MNEPRQPLQGKRIVITRAADQAGDFAESLIAIGARPILFPTIQIAPMADSTALDAALRDLNNYDWMVFTSANGVQITLDRLHQLAIDPHMLNRCQIAAVGNITANALITAGVAVTLTPDEATADSLADSLTDRAADQRFLLLQAAIARSLLADSLIAHGAHVTTIPIYRTVCGQPAAAAFAELRAGIDVLTFTSGSTVRNFADLVGHEARPIAETAVLACIGHITADVARSLGFRVDVIATESTTDGLIDAIARYFDPTCDTLGLTRSAQ